MKEQSYFTFSINNSLGYLSIAYVEEIFALPELTLIPECPQSLVGVVNLRGEILPVMDLNLSFTELLYDYHLTDSVVVISWEGLRVGIIVNEVHGVRNLSPEQINTELSRDGGKAVVEEKTILDRIISCAEDILILNKSESWSRYIGNQQVTDHTNAAKLESNGSKGLPIQPPIFWPNSTPEERAIFQERADNLKLAADTQDLKALRSLAVIGLNDNFFGVDLAIVREFTDIYQVTPVPCCPAHIIGNVNLRGEILTLVDIRRFLNLPLTGIPAEAKAMVIEVEGVVAGVMVAEVHEAMFFLNPGDITVEPIAIPSLNHEYLEGVAFYQEKMMAIVDLPKLFLKGGLIVDEVV
ncbi:MAG TPA: chemotaxis protein CheW [Cyanobacteria bacterium UBA8803]|nr:chemotaxis protein CheW [Cyanobacteria bacterium UBA9273]HBL61143.1 chemotaxis protein CheW [Cyanobacteria bacterium UBA8803]